MARLRFQRRDEPGGATSRQRRTNDRPCPRAVGGPLTLDKAVHSRILCIIKYMQILRAAHLGMCYGVRDAIALALEHAATGPLTILGDLVHNPTVLEVLQARGIG